MTNMSFTVIPKLNLKGYNDAVAKICKSTYADVTSCVLFWSTNKCTFALQIEKMAAQSNMKLKYAVLSCFRNIYVGTLLNEYGFKQADYDKTVFQVAKEVCARNLGTVICHRMLPNCSEQKFGWFVVIKFGQTVQIDTLERTGPPKISNWCMFCAPVVPIKTLKSLWSRFSANPYIWLFARVPDNWACDVVQT